MLEPDALVEASRLTELLDADDGDLNAYLVLGLLRWYRYNALPEGPDAAELDAALDMLTPCFISGVPDLPEPLLPELAVRAAPTAVEVLGQALDSPDLEFITFTADLWRRIVDAASPGHPDHAVMLGNLGIALQIRFERTGEPPDVDEAVRLGRAALAATPAGHPDQAMHLSNLGIALRMRHERTGEPSDADEAVTLARQAMAAAPADDPERPGLLVNLSLALRSLFELTGVLPQVDEAIEAARAAVAATPADALERAGRLSNLCVALRIRFERTGVQADADESVEAGREAVRALPGDHSDPGMYLSNLGTALQARFEQTGNLADADEAVSAGRSAVQATPADHPDRAGRLGNLGLALRARFERTGATADLEEAVRWARAALAATPADHAGRAGRLGNLGSVLHDRFVRGIGPPSDLDEAISAMRAAVAATPDGHPERPRYLSDLGGALQTRFEGTRLRTDLDESVRVTRAAVAAVPDDHPERPRYLSNLGLVLQTRFEWAGSTADLDEAIEAGRAAVESSDPRHPERASYLSNVGLALRMRFEHGGADADLDEAVELGRAAVAACPADHPYRGGCLNNLGLALRMRFERTGAQTDLDDAVDAGRAAVEATPADHPDRAAMLSNLGLALRIRFERTGAEADLDEAVDTGRGAVAATPTGHPARAGRLSNLALALRSRFERTGVSADIDEAVEAASAAAAATPDDHPERAGQLNNLGIALRTRFEDTGVPADLDNAVEAGRRAARLVAPDHPDRAMYLSNLTLALRARFERAGAPADIDEAVRAGREAVRPAPSDHPDLAAYLINLGLALRARHGRDEAHADADEATACFERAAGLATAAPSLRIGAARHGASLSMPAHTPARMAAHMPARVSRAAGLLEQAVRLLPEVAPRRLERGDQQHALRAFAGLAADAAALALSDPSLPEDRRVGRALALLEAGRGVLLSQSLDTRGDLTDLHERHPRLAIRFTELRDRYDRPGVTAGRDDRRRTAADLAALMEEIRSLPGFESFALPPALRELHAQAAEGPVVIINVADHRSDALLLTENDITVRPLPDLSPATLIEHVTAFHSALPSTTDLRLTFAQRRAAQNRLHDTLRWLWDTVAEPVLRTLGHDLPPEDGVWPRVWWAPGGILGLLPLHAAGHHVTAPGTPSGHTVMDRVVSSYTPTVRALGYARGRTRDPAQETKSLIVAMPDTPGVAAPLEHVAAEAELLRARLPGPVLLVEPPPSGAGTATPIPTRAEVLSHLPECAITHFACHGVSDPADPSRSRLLLHDHRTEPLTVAALNAVHLDRARLAYLSACRTAFTADVRLLDESIHLVSALQLAGFPRVIGTLWEVNDAFAVDVADAFYTALDDGDGLDPARSAHALHHTIRAARDRYPHLPSLWAGYIHAGA
ncbi:CHAT domain-containing protein [Thermopolyspora sp. NPDC052614]|uniref:CHAT domain-containing tetratricopeptide repeat protein n=1 Tax=Thermopolyspora sp. NPDC052614 TaxID=3155682 RepID=UPI00343B385C